MEIPVLLICSYVEPRQTRDRLLSPMPAFSNAAARYSPTAPAPKIHIEGTADIADGAAVWHTIADLVLRLQPPASCATRKCDVPNSRVLQP